MGGPMGMAGMITSIGSQLASMTAGVMNARDFLKTASGLSKDNWKTFGQWGLMEQRGVEEQMYANQAYSEAQLQRENTIQTNTARRRSRQTALGLNALRAGDAITEAAAGRNYLSALGNLKSNFGQQLVTLGQQKVAQANTIDEARRKGADAYDETMRGIAGDYFTGMSSVIAQAGNLGTAIGGTMQQTAGNYNALGYLGEMNPYLNFKANRLVNKT
jgi:hypothetical protein